LSLSVAARNSPLSRKQVEEVAHLMQIELVPSWVETRGDKDQCTSLRTLVKTDFFTHEIDEMVLTGQVRIGVHSFKDLPDPLPKGLYLAATTPCLDARDALVIQQGLTLSALPFRALIATSSERREQAALLLRPDFRFKDIRGTIGQRLQVLDNQEVDGVIIAEAALLRLGLTHLTRVYLPGQTAVGQGQLAVVCRACDEEIIAFFQTRSLQHC